MKHLRNRRFAWSEKPEQDKRMELQRVSIGSKFIKHADIEDQVDMAEHFIDLLSKNQEVNKEDIIEGLCRRWYCIKMEEQACLSQEQTVQNEEFASEMIESPQANGISAADKYKKKDDNTVNEVCSLLFHGNNYSEIARKLHIDRRTVKKIAVKHGFTKE